MGGRSNMPRMLGDEEIGQIGFHSDDLLTHNLEEKGWRGALLNSDPWFFLYRRRDTKKEGENSFLPHPTPPRSKSGDGKKGCTAACIFFSFPPLVMPTVGLRVHGRLFFLVSLLLTFSPSFFLAQEWHSREEERGRRLQRHHQ